MKNIMKLATLVVALLLVMVGVAAFLWTRVSPPDAKQYDSPYAKSVSAQVENLAKSTTAKAQDYQFAYIHGTIQYMRAEGRLSNEDANKLMQDLAHKYIPMYVASCKKTFQSSVWDDAMVRGIHTRVAELNAMRTTDGKPLVSSEQKPLLGEVDQVSVDYAAARAAATATGYAGLQSARTRIATAKNYAAKAPLKNCTDLVQQLHNVPTRLEASHYAHLSGLVAQMNPTRFSGSAGAYDALADRVNQELKEYDASATSTYGMHHDTSGLKNQAANYYTQFIMKQQQQPTNG